MKKKKKIKDSQLVGIFMELIKEPVAFIVVIVCLAIAVFADIKGTTPFINTLLFLLWAIMVACCAVIIICRKDYRAFIRRRLLYAFIWFSSCLVLTDFTNFSFDMLSKLITSFLLIFFGCLLPDFIPWVKNEDKKDDSSSKEESE